MAQIETITRGGEARRGREATASAAWPYGSAGTA